jgi:RND family efflux transporter MFP subunit
MAVVAGAAVVVAVVGGSWAQNSSSGSSSTTTARVETAPLELTPPDRYQIPVVLEPTRRVAIMATSDGILRSISVPVGSTVREGQDIADLDRAEAKAKLKIAEAAVKEMQAEVDAAKSQTSKSSSAESIANARLDAAKARAELAQLEIDRCTLRAPFAGRVLSASVSPGQYVSKGTTIAELVDTSYLKVLVPVDRTMVKSGSTLELFCEGKTVTGKIQALLPLSEAFAALRELATPWTAAWLSVANSDGALEPGLRVRGPSLPSAPVATVASRSVHNAASAGGGNVQVVRGDYVTNIPVTVLGSTGPERTQVTGPFRPSDLLIVESSVPLAAGTFLRFEVEGTSGNRPVEGSTPKPGESGAMANITPPSGAGGHVAPIGSPGGTSAKNPPRTGTKPAAKPASNAPAKGATPF